MREARARAPVSCGALGHKTPMTGRDAIAQADQAFIH